MASRPPSASPPTTKAKRKILSLKEKLTIIEESEKGLKRFQIMEKYGIKKTTLHDILKTKDKVRAAFAKLEQGQKGEKIFRVRKLPHEGLDDAVFKWYRQQRSEGVPVRGVDLQHAAERLSVHLGHVGFKYSEGWLWRFRKRHGIINKAITGELLSADTAAVEPFIEELKVLIEEENLHLFQVYNADETGLTWRALPRNTQAAITISSTPGRKKSKDKISIMVCGNADGSHRLLPVVVGRAKTPRPLANLMSQLPVEYYGNLSAWFNQVIIKHWFHKVFDPAARKHQARYGIPEEDIKTLLLMDNAPAHPPAETMISKDGRIKMKFLPANTTSLIQPMDQGVIENPKRHYRSLFLHQCLVVIEDGMDEPGYVDIRGKKSLANFKTYNIKDVIYNWAEAWKQIPLNTLKNAWVKLLNTEKVTAKTQDFKGFDLARTGGLLQQAGQGNISEEELEEWLLDDADLQGHHHLSDAEIAEEVLHPPEEAAAEEQQQQLATRSIASGIDAADTLLQIIDERGRVLTKHYEMVRLLHLELMQEQQQTQVQHKISDFFKPLASVAKRQRMTRSESSDM